ncbi:ribonucleotide reductase [Halalkalibacter akibai JCM 9157]|uniref:Ribonucleoside-diphosphate reductase n=1 Tax=Halalkalibacter akibai (strain ATCC 43226 / DSM 21942 / CIP 109018 / JCM 9157 / 1139) TaxID=1236973 RepID=W4QVX8_HALA3|nr:ribonucleotide reductase [Halalkalibacter akibai JCM 9157]
MNSTEPLNMDQVTGNMIELEQLFPELDFSFYREKVGQAVRSKVNISDDQISQLLVLSAVENISMEEPQWTYVAASILLKQLYKKAACSRQYEASIRYGSFYQLVQSLTDIGIYSDRILQEYSREELEELGQIIEPERDSLFTYIGLLTLADRYLARSHNGDLFELPQERFLIIAITLMMEEPKETRIELIKEAYWALSNLYMTVATPTLANAGKSYGQLSSCFIETVDDSLRGIYDSNTDIATLSKNGGGIGAYLGKLRSRGSDIKGFKGVSSGVIPWMKQLNNTAVSVDQLGQRQGE